MLAFIPSKRTLLRALYPIPAPELATDSAAGEYGRRPQKGRLLGAEGGSAVAHACCSPVVCGLLWVVVDVCMCRCGYVIGMS